MKKEKIIYIDDGRIIADMSGVSGGFQTSQRPKYQPRASIKEQLKTFFGAMKMMFLPMLAVVAVMIVVYLLLFVVFSLI